MFDHALVHHSNWKPSLFSFLNHRSNECIPSVGGDSPIVPDRPHPKPKNGDETMSTINNWAEEYEAEQKEQSQYEQLPKVVIKDGEQKGLEFVDEGKSVKTKFGDAILFQVMESGQKKYWWVRRTQYNILNPLVKNRPLLGKRAVITRIGSTKDDTRYSLKFYEKKEGVQ